MKKRFLVGSVIFAVAASAAAFAGCFQTGVGGNDENNFVRDNMRFILKDDGTYELDRYEYADLKDREDADGNFTEGYKGDGETVIVPDTVNGKAVTSVKEYAFAHTGVKSVTLPGAISVLPDRVFEECSLLETVNMSVITSVGGTAFYKCARLADISFESGLTEIGERAFEGCTALATVSLPDTVKTLGANCFNQCAFSTVNTAGVEVLGERAFYQCENLTALCLPEVISIGENALRFCGGLEELTLGGKLTDIPQKMLIDCVGLKRVSINRPVPAEMFTGLKNVAEATLGEGVTSIGKSAFGGCSGLTEITLPSTLTEIGENAFSASGLTKVTVPASVKYIGDRAFYRTPIKNLTVESGVEGIGAWAFAYAPITSLTVPASVESVGDSAFYRTTITNLTVENGVQSIGGSAFYQTLITSLNLPASVKSVGDTAFYGCNSLADVSLAEGLETVGSGAFAMAGGDTLEIILPSTVKFVGDGCFDYAYGDIAGMTANKIIINDTVETVGKKVVKGCRVKELAAPVSYGHNVASVETLTLFGEGDIPYDAYKNFETLKNVNLGAGVKRIYARAFTGLENLRMAEVEHIDGTGLGDISKLNYTRTEGGVNYIDNWVISADYSQGGAANLDLSGITGIYENAFKKTETNDTSVLNTVVFVGSDDTSAIKHIGKNAFEGTGITAVEIPATLETWDYAFTGCTALKYIKIASGVQTVPLYAFAGCKGLTGINLERTDLVEICMCAFSDCTNLNTVTLPESLKLINNGAFSYAYALTHIDLKNVETLGSSAFYASGLESITMNAVKTLWDMAFSRCFDLTEVDLPATLEHVYKKALDRVNTVNYAGTQEQWESIIGNISVFGSSSVTVKFSDGTEKVYLNEV